MIACMRRERAPNRLPAPPAGEHIREWCPVFTNIATRDAGRTPSDAGHARVNPEASIIR
jgi:hypothetical protein